METLLLKARLKKYFFCTLKTGFIFSVAMFFSTNSYSQNNVTNGNNSSVIPKWSSNPFEQKVFIENKSQFDGNDSLPDSHILFGVRNEGIQIYFTPEGLTYRRDEPVKMTEAEKEKYEKAGVEAELMQKTKTDYVSMHWLNANPNVQIVAENPVNNYFTYGDLRDKSGKTTIKAFAYKKIIYKNIYPNIDVEYTFPEDKKGIKYSIILHPGADVSLVQMNYSGNATLSKEFEGHLSIKSGLGIIFDHAPNTQYETGQSISSYFSLHKNIVSFDLDTYDHTKTVVIDPWVTTPTYAGAQNAYDVDCDLAGNVYIYGGSSPFQESKLNSAGTILWTYTATPLSSNGYYGDFAVDGHSQNSYLIEGFNPGTGAKIAKVSTNGLQIGLFPGNSNMVEMWRIVYNNCTHTSVIAGGGTSVPYQACVLDSNVSAITPVNILGASTALHDFALLAQDNNSNCYMATAKSVVYPTIFDNVMVKAPIPALSPTAYMVSDGYTFQEVGSITYIPSTPNGFNGMAVSPNFLYTYDGAVLKKWNSSTGALLASVTVTGTSFTSGGLQVDNCDHIFVGAQNTIKQYDVNLNLVATIPASNTVYDLKLGKAGLIYACGLGFVQSIQLILPPCAALTLTMTSTSACSSSNTATVTVSGGVAPYIYSWSTLPSQTTATATGLNPGKYYVTVTDNSCVPLTQKDSVIIVAGSSMAFTTSSTISNCSNSSGTATVNPSGGTPAYTYGWTPSGQTTQTATGLAPGTYTVAVTDSKGCVKDTTIIVPGSPAVTVTISPTNILCNGANTGILIASPAGGTTPYTYSWSPSGGTSATASNLVAGNYTLTVTDAAGCTVTAIANVAQPPAIALTTSSKKALCVSPDGSATVAATGGTGIYTYYWTPTGQTTQTATGLVSGIYSITVTDANHCTKNTVVSVLDSGSVSSTITTVTNVSCFGMSNGSITVNAAGGTGAYTYLWTPTGQTTATATGLAPGTYSVTVKDANGCSIMVDTSIIQPTALDT
ncbi:MAG: SprB repeat-containing protein, partial [Bacteroidia bacterium]